MVQAGSPQIISAIEELGPGSDLVQGHAALPIVRQSPQVEALSDIDARP
jgi:hypothetical protein